MPLLAVSAHSTQRDLDMGREAGFDDYVAKSDRDGLLEAIEQVFTFRKEAA